MGRRNKIHNKYCNIKSNLHNMQLIIYILCFNDRKQIFIYFRYLRATIIYGYKFYRILKIVDLMGSNFSDFAITCSIY